MDHRRTAAAFLAVVAATMLMTSDLVLAEDPAAKGPTIKELMGDNFAGLQKILVGLVTSNYATVPADATVIHDHAADLMRVVPESAKDDRERYMAYAYSLQSNAKLLREIVELLIEHDRAREPEAGLGTDSLREVAAAHYGNIVTMCVACHNRFRPRVVQ